MSHSDHDGAVPAYAAPKVKRMIRFTVTCQIFVCGKQRMHSMQGTESCPDLPLFIFTVTDTEGRCFSEWTCPDTQPPSPCFVCVDFKTYNMYCFCHVVL